MRPGLLTMRSKYMAAFRKARSHFLKIIVALHQCMLPHVVCKQRVNLRITLKEVSDDYMIQFSFYEI